MQHLPRKHNVFLQFGISCELGNRKKWDGKHKGRTLPVKTQCFVHLGISCELGIEKMGRETDRRHLLVRRQCLAQFGMRSPACTLMFPQHSLETKRCENIRERDGTNWGVRHAAHPSWYRMCPVWVKVIGYPNN